MAGDQPQAVTRSTSMGLPSNPLANVSMPSTLRKAKRSLVGTKKMPNDPLEAQRQEVAAFDALLNSLLSMARVVETGVDMVAQAPQPLKDQLSRFYTQDVPGSPVVAQMCTQLNKFVVGTQKAASHLNAMQESIQELNTQNADVLKAFNQRDEAYEEQQRYRSKVEWLHGQVSKYPVSPKLSEKLNRNVGKQQEHEQAFDRSMEETSRMANNVLSVKWQKSAELLSRLCKYYVTVFEACAVLSTDMREVSEQLVGPSTTEAMMRKGQEMADKAKERVSTFSKGVREKLKWGSSPDGFGGAGADDAAGAGPCSGAQAFGGRMVPTASSCGSAYGNQAPGSDAWTSVGTASSLRSGANSAAAGFSSAMGAASSAVGNAAAKGSAAASNMANEAQAAFSSPDKWSNKRSEDGRKSSFSSQGSAGRQVDDPFNFGFGSQASSRFPGGDGSPGGFGSGGTNNFGGSGDWGGFPEWPAADAGTPQSQKGTPQGSQHMGQTPGFAPSGGSASPKVDPWGQPCSPTSVQFPPRGGGSGSLQFASDPWSQPPQQPPQQAEPPRKGAPNPWAS